MQKNKYRKPYHGRLYSKNKYRKCKKECGVFTAYGISFKIISEKIITGRSGLGDCENKNSTGKKHR
jgi:hypothetical protein